MPATVQKLNTEAIVQKILDHYRGDVLKIILFGSQVRGEEDEWSDLDLIVIRNTEERFVERLSKTPILPQSADIFVYTPEEFERMKEGENQFILSALQGAKVVYSKNR
ncbi:MAG: polymerase beta domain protein region protein [Candidatus Jorgensenbacteria bacterium GW2011_GWA1_48_13]|uniref:Polymerase beta domain protein region protein n=2 Tax=Candidatus Joergenseniibacteriota TaxID=1752739 RepID=A0A0G1Z795_9BACT|nr:MAG: polymerase beta domain protein region protein [Candidatus Jorgensenbacteria bacterium GW2011_GWA1_48_13]KKU99233.1 MAG: polymerase beta domain protein region protein [Candidatus Jorgensenbacteria bacterium GW2011_GWC1_48_8]KKW14804.1 MAG: polymerase beta domain protein region protein [Candidatus Jorgensenbacteria bacterium GW2011_GWB1_50_10]